MLATKTGIRRHGQEQGNYRNLVWLGRPANVASKLTDAANKPAEYVSVPMVDVAYETRIQGAVGALAFGLGAGLLSPYNSLLQQPPGETKWTWVDETPSAFLSQLEVHYSPSRLTHKNSNFQYFYVKQQRHEARAATPPILLTSAVWNGFKKAKPNSLSVQNSLFNKVAVEVPGHSGETYGGDVVFPQLKP